MGSSLATIADFQKFNPFRTPQWRYDRIADLVQHFPNVGRCSKRDDQYIRIGKAFYAALKKCADEEGRQKLYWDQPHLYHASQIHDRAVLEPEIAGFIECRVLAAQSPEEIAQAVGCSPETVVWYERLFFDVRDRLEHRDWVTKHVFMASYRRHSSTFARQNADSEHLILARPFLDATLKLFAYFGGRHVLELLITGFKTTPIPQPDELGRWFDEHWSLTLKRRSCQAALAFEINRYNVMELFGVHAHIIELERQAADNDPQQLAAHEKAIKESIDRIKWSIAERDMMTEDSDDPMIEYDRQADELRDGQVRAVARGGKPLLIGAGTEIEVILDD